VSESAHRPPGLSRRKTAAIVGLCFLIAVLEGYDIQAFGVAAPLLVAELGLDPGQQGFAASIAMIGLIGGAFIGGIGADRLGRRPVLTASVLVFGAGSVWTGFVEGYGALLAARAVTGLGFGGALPLLIAVAAEVSPPGRRALTTSFMFCGMPIGGAGVSLFAGLSSGADSWRWIFIVGGVLPLLLALAITRVLPETRPAQAGENENALEALFGGRRALATLLLWAVNFLTLVTLYLMLNWLPSLVVATGQSPAVGASAALSFNLVGAAGALVFGWLADRYGIRGPLLFGYAALAVSLLLLAGSASVEAILSLAAACGFFTLGTQYALYSLPPAIYPAGARGIGAGASVAVGRLGSIAGPLLAGIARQAGASPADVLRMLVPVAVMAGVAALLLGLTESGRALRGARRSEGMNLERGRAGPAPGEGKAT
jgi:MFS transporter, AAHS family, 3-hydroxyphenylpropionic acid transporter